MLNGKFLVEDGVINMDDIMPNCLNLIQSNCGSGKTTFVLKKLIYTEEKCNKILYLIDTCAGRDGILKEYPNLVRL